jgi:transcriptional antiterminator Rof (Rho-off)
VSHVIERCDVIDVLEESARLHRRVLVTLKGGRHFVDEARTVETTADGEWVVFREHDRILIDDIASCAPPEPPEPSYRGKI